MNTPQNASGSPERCSAQGPQVDSLESAPTDAESTTAPAGTFPANDTDTQLRRALVRAILSTLDASTRAALLVALASWWRALVLVCVEGGGLFEAERTEEHASKLAPAGVSDALVAAWSRNSVCELHTYASRRRGEYGEHTFVTDAARVALGDITVMLGELGAPPPEGVAVAPLPPWCAAMLRDGTVVMRADAGQWAHDALVTELLEYAAGHNAPALALAAAHVATDDHGDHAATMVMLAVERLCEHAAERTRTPGRDEGAPTVHEREFAAANMREVARLLTLASRALDGMTEGGAR